MTQIDPDVLAQSIVDVVDQAVAPLRERLAAVEALAGAAARHDDATVATLRDTCANPHDPADARPRTGRGARSAARRAGTKTMIESTNLVDDEHVSEPQIALPSGARVNLFVFELIMRLVDQGRAVFLDDRQDVIVRPDAGVHPDLLWSLTASRQDVRRIVDELITPLEEGESRAPVGDANRESLPRGPRTKQRHSSQRIDELWRRPRPYSWRDRVPRRG